MKFGIIYSVDITDEFQPYDDSLPRGIRPETRLPEWNPRKVVKRRGAWNQTENSSSTFKDWEGPHAKWIGLLNKMEMLDFLKGFGFSSGTMCETGGAMGMPGCDPWYGMAPAWSVDADCRHALVNAYITPWPEIARKTGKADSKKNWCRMKRALKRMF